MSLCIEREIVMFFIPIVAGWALGAQSAKLIDYQLQKRARLPLKTVSNSSPIPEKTNPLQAVIEAMPKFKKDREASQWEKVDPDMESRYSKYVEEISLEEEELTEEQKIAHQGFVKASIMLASTTISALVYPPLLFLHIPPMLYLAIPFYKQAYDDFFNEQKVTTTVVDATLSIGSLGCAIVHPPILVISVAGSWFFTLTAKVVSGSKASTRKSLSNIVGEQPPFVWLLKDGIEVEVPFETVQVGDILVVDAGQVIPVDGAIYDGVASIDQHMLTGESRAVDAGIGERVFAGTVLLSGKIYIQVEKTGEETAAAQIGQILIQTSDFTSSLQLRGQEITDDAALPTFILASLSLPLLGINSALAILYSGIGYNMSILGPISMLNYIQRSARQGIVIKDGRVLEQVTLVDTIVFDKTANPTKDVVHGLRQLGLEMYLVSGDNEGPTRALAEELGIEHYFAGTQPRDACVARNKADLVAKLQEEGKFVCFVGDGVNDAIALKKAQVSVSLRGAESVAVDSAQIILLDQSLDQLETLFSICQEFERNMQISLMSTIVPGVIIIGGAFLGAVSYAGSIGLFFAGLTAGLINTMTPVLTAPKTRRAALNSGD